MRRSRSAESKRGRMAYDTFGWTRALIREASLNCRSLSILRFAGHRNARNIANGVRRTGCICHRYFVFYIEDVADAFKERLRKGRILVEWFCQFARRLRALVVSSQGIHESA
jgi:hypothetical protein